MNSRIVLEIQLNLCFATTFRPSTKIMVLVYQSTFWVHFTMLAPTLYQCYTTWLVFGVSSFSPSTMLALWRALISPTLVWLPPQCLFHCSRSFFQMSSLLVGYGVKRRQSNSFKSCSIGFMSGDCGLHGNIVIAWSLNHSNVDMLTCYGSLLCWNTHSFASCLNFAVDMLKLSWKKSWQCLLSISPLIMVNSPRPYQPMQPRTMMLPPPCFTILPTTRLLTGSKPLPTPLSSIYQTPQCWIYFHTRIRLSYNAHSSDPQALCSYML